MSWEVTDTCCLGCYARWNLYSYATRHCWCWLAGFLVHTDTGPQRQEEKVFCCAGPCLLVWGYDREHLHHNGVKLTQYIEGYTPLGLIGYSKSNTDTHIHIRVPCGGLDKVTPLSPPAETGAAKE